MDELQQYRADVNECSRTLNDIMLATNQTINKVVKLEEDALSMMETMLQDVTQVVDICGDDTTDLTAIKDYLSKVCHEHETVRQQTKCKKEDLKRMKLTIDQKLVGLTKELDDLMKENHELEHQLSHPNLPLILKLMSSKQH